MALFFPEHRPDASRDSILITIVAPSSDFSRSERSTRTPFGYASTKSLTADERVRPRFGFRSGGLPRDVQHAAGSGDGLRNFQTTSGTAPAAIAQSLRPSGRL
jgi:hypothetical protein